MKQGNNDTQKVGCFRTARLHISQDSSRLYLWVLRVVELFPGVLADLREDEAGRGDESPARVGEGVSKHDHLHTGAS